MSISQNFADSYIAFESLRAAAKDKEKQHGETMTVIAGEFDKYTIWADKSGAARSGKDFRLSLDYQLREASFYKDQVVKLLQNLQENTEKALSMLSDGHNNEKDGQDLPKDGETQGLKGSDGAGCQADVQDAEVQRDAVEDESKAAKPTDDIETTPATKKLSADFWKLMSSINSTISTLEKVPVRNRNSINEIKDEELEGGIAREHFDILHVRDKLPDKNLDPKVITRLGKMITRRRQLLLSLRSRRDEFRMSVSLAGASVPSLKKVAALDAPPNTAATENFDSQGQGDKPLPSIRDSVLFAPSEPGSASGSSTPPGTQVGKQQPQIPPRPRNSAGLGMTRFECKYCFMTPYVPSDTEWKNHILRDLQPYVCTFASCSLVDRVFENRDAWWEHEISHHRSQFYCNTPGHARYRDQTAFQSHMRDEHNADQVQPELLARFRRPVKSQGGKCNLCSREARDLKRHVARHLEQLALFSIPRSDFDEGDGGASRRLSLNPQSKPVRKSQRNSKDKANIYEDDKTARGNVDSLLEELIEAKGLQTNVPDDDDDDSTTCGTGSTVGQSPKDTATTQSLLRKSESRSESPIPVPINTPYKRVGVLMFTWSDPRPAISFFDLEHTLRCRYRFDVRVEEIPTDGDVSQYFTRGISDLIRDFRGRSDLMIIYYAGRARFLSRSQDLEFRSNRDFFEFDVPCASMSWKLIESKLLADNNVKSDVLAVLEDSAAIDFASGNEISQILETPDAHAPSSSSSSASSDNSGEEKRDRCFQFLTMRRTTPYPQASFTEAMNQVLLDSTSGIDASDLAYHMTLQNEYGHATRNPCYVFHRLNPPGRDIAIAPLPAPKKEESPLPEVRHGKGDGKAKLSQSDSEAKGEEKGSDSTPASPAPSSISVSNHPLVLMAKQVTLKPFVWPAQFNPYSAEYVGIPRTNRDRLHVPEPASRSSPSPIGRVASEGREAAGPVVERKHFSLLHPRFPFRHQRDQRDLQERKQQIQTSQLGSFKFDQFTPSKLDQTPRRRLPRRRKPNVPVYENDLDLPSTLSLSLSLSLPTPTLSLPGPAPHVDPDAYERHDNEDDAAPGPTVQRRRPSPTFLSRRNTIASTQFLDGGMFAPQQPRRLSRTTMNHVRSSSQGNQSRTLTLNPRNTDTRSIILDSTDDYLYGGYVANEDLIMNGEPESAPAPQIPTHIARPRRSASRSSLQLLSNSISRHGSFSRRRPLTASGSTPSLASTVASMLGPAPGPIYNPMPNRNDRATSAPAPVVPLTQPEPVGPVSRVSRGPDQDPQKEHQSLKRSASMSLRHSLSLRRSITGSLRRSATLIGIVGSTPESALLKATASSPSLPYPASLRLESNLPNMNSATGAPNAQKDNLATNSNKEETAKDDGSSDNPTNSNTVEAAAPAKSHGAAESAPDNRISVIAPLPHMPSFPILASSSRATTAADLSSIPLPPAPEGTNGGTSGGLRRSPWGSMRRGRSLRRSISGLFSAGASTGGAGVGKGDKTKTERAEEVEVDGSADAEAAETQKQKRARSRSRASRDGQREDAAVRGSGVLAESSGNRGSAAGVESGGTGSAAADAEKSRPDSSGTSDMEKKAKKKRSRAELWAGFRAGVSRRGR
ncbi:uncharacterized protein J3D65DRAFT_374991 [Phyllosticta citribraziliensis]|uniref:C2H2-type domain-containing protein n=1 Tax=Phyllosticta citribraziliensis TaxID=989973 RepID=A0ABR1LQ41_9PEZI